MNISLNNQLPSSNKSRKSSHFIICNFAHKNVPFADFFFTSKGNDQQTYTSNFYIYRLQIHLKISLLIVFMSRYKLPKNQLSNSYINRKSSCYISYSFSKAVSCFSVVQVYKIWYFQSLIIFLLGIRSIWNFCMLFYTSPFIFGPIYSFQNGTYYLILAYLIFSMHSNTIISLNLRFNVMLPSFRRHYLIRCF